MSNILEVSQQQAIQALAAKGWSGHRIARTLGINRRTVKRYASGAGSKCTSEVTTGSGPPDEPKCTTEVTTGSRSLCGAFREVIVPMLELGLSAQRIYQDLVAAHGFEGSYPSVRRYAARLKASEPERVWRIECQPGEELQVDFGLGAPLIEPGGKTRRTWLFRAVLSHSRKGYSEVVLRQDTETFIRVLENAVRHFGGVPRLLNFDNLKAAVIKADWYDPALNPKLADFCRHYGMTPMPCRSYTPQHKGKVERGVGYAKNNALKGRRFADLDSELLRIELGKTAGDFIGVQELRDGFELAEASNSGSRRARATSPKCLVLFSLFHKRGFADGSNYCRVHVLKVGVLLEIDEWLTCIHVSIETIGANCCASEESTIFWIVRDPVFDELVSCHRCWLVCSLIKESSSSNLGLHGSIAPCPAEPGAAGGFFGECVDWMERLPEVCFQSHRPPVW